MSSAQTSKQSTRFSVLSRGIGRGLHLFESMSKKNEPYHRDLWVRESRLTPAVGRYDAVVVVGSIGRATREKVG